MPANRIQIQNALHKPYDRILFSREVLSPVFGSGFTLNSSLVPASVSPNKSESAAIDKVWIYGNIKLDDSTEVSCYEVLLQPKVRIEQSKVAIQQYVRKLLTAGQAALINFVAPANKNVWRLTLVAKDSVLTEKGVKEKTTNAKRYTFLLGPSETCKTAAERFETLSTEKEITFQTLVNAFSVEKLSKAFFNEYTLHYQKFCDYLQESSYRRSVFNISFPAGASKQEKDKVSKPIRDFVKKLLGRIVFLYFVQKKGWLGATNIQYNDGMPDFIKKLFLQSGGDETFYSNWLTVLFFDTLNKERANDDFKMPDGKTVKVPFLNGGLFDKEEFDEHLLTFPAKLFHHPDFEDTILTEKNKSNARGFLDFLDAFNFTVYEDSPDDHTVAVDPEMLGHIFENLLEDNKDKGAFYTPKEIVHYMCQESLKEYLTTGLQNEYTVYRQIGNEQIELFGNETRTGQLKIIEELGEKGLDREEVAYMVKHKDISKLTQKQLHSIDRLLDNVKICDPAIGSGAFPMGLLQEIFSIKELIAYETGKEWKPAETKLNIIQNSIYGVDIEKGAVDIARLRFWLSLVVDEEKPKALPNLDYKIVVGDSLISKFDGECIEIHWEIKENTQTDIFGNENLQKRKQLLLTLTEKQRKYFDPTNKNKKNLALEIRNLKIDVLINQLELMVKSEGLEQAPVKTNFKDNKKFVAAQELYQKTQGWLNTINKLKHLKNSPPEQKANGGFNHFDWKLDFPEVLNPYLVNGNAGFDIVIGNPPYIQLQKDGGKLAQMYEARNFQTFARTGDIYTLFYEKGIQLLKPKGVLCLITSNKWMRAGYGEKLRSFFTQYNPLLLIDLGPKVFENATVDTNILIVQNSPDTNPLPAVTYTDKNKTIETTLKEQSVILNKLSKDAWFIGSSAEQQLKEKIEKIGTPLKDWDVNIYRGVLTGLNEAFIISTEKRNEIIANCKNEDEQKRTEAIIKPILRGRDIKRYYYEWAGLWVIGTFPALDLNIEDFPALKKYLLNNFDIRQLEQSGKKYPELGFDARKKTGNKWFETQDQIAYYPEFEKEKVVYSETIKIYFDGTKNYPRFSYTTKELYLDKTTFFMSGENQKYFLGVLNSKVSEYLLENGYCIKLGTGSRGLQKILIEKIPIPPIPATKQPIVEQIEMLVDRILYAKKADPQADTSEWEREIDRLVYKLYELTEEEIKIIEEK